MSEGATPTYIARCPTCQGMIACAVAPVDEPKVMRDAANHRLRWERSGLVVTTGTVDDVRFSSDSFGHKGECPKRRKRRKQ